MFLKSSTRVWIKFLLFFILFVKISSKEIPKCDLVTELITNKFERTFLTNWVCLAEYESNRLTHKITKKYDGSQSYGIFQINNKKWCDSGVNDGGICNTPCKNFIDDNITDDALCAMKIFETSGFKTWDGWLKFCKLKPLPRIDDCESFMEIDSSAYDNIVRHRFNYNRGNPVLYFNSIPLYLSTNIILINNYL